MVTVLQQIDYHIWWWNFRCLAPAENSMLAYYSSLGQLLC